MYLAYSHNNLGLLLSLSGEPAEAGLEHRKALALFRKLAEDDPSVPHYQDRAANEDSNLSAVMRRPGRPAEARDHAEKAVAIREQLVKAHPQSADYRAGLAESLLDRGLARRALRDHAGAVSDIRRALALLSALPSPAGEQWFLRAGAHAALAGLAGRDGSGVSAAEATSEADTAMALLHRAISMGHRNSDAYRIEDALDPLRNRSDFELLIMDLAFPAEAFARDE
jgi:tetratricopeptide (TPR) repeat protein